MFRFSAFIFMLLLFTNEALKELCSESKVDNTCICKRITDENQNLIVTVGDCTRINLQDFPDQIQLKADLNVLDLSHNEIKKLDQNYPKYSSITLETLILSYNYISYISDGFFKEIPNVRRLILSHNNLTSLDNQDIFESSKKLLYLDLSFNNIKTLQDNIFLPLVRLQMLDLSYNDVTLGEWLMQSSDSLSVNLGLNQNISDLKMNNIGLKELNNMYFNKYTSLKYLSLADNHFENVPNVPYTVEYLDLSGSDISVLQAKHLNYHSLKILKLERMKKLENIHQYAFYNLQALEELYITDCHKLTEFNELIFGLLSKNTILPLRRLSLARNSLQHLNYTYKYLFKIMSHIDLRHNPWNCDCDLLWFQEFDNFYKREDIKCSSPSYLSNRLIFDITDKDLQTCYPQKYGKKAHRILIPILILLVIVLSSLIGYLIYYAPSWYGGRSRGVGPQSPYSTTRIDEN